VLFLACSLEFCFDFVQPTSAFGTGALECADGAVVNREAVGIVGVKVLAAKAEP
jgi:hypothetical protein